jgi:hypothetical protein
MEKMRKIFVIQYKIYTQVKQNLKNPGLKNEEKTSLS